MAHPSASSPPPSLTLPSDETALFIHSPPSSSSSPSTSRRPKSKSISREWEPGRQPDAVYDAALPAWRAGVRRWMVRRLEWESPAMARWHQRWRGGRAMDGWFYWTAVFGTHTFFMAFLPLFFFFGDSERGRGMLYIVGLGIWLSSFVKDLFCTPRPYSPPIIRLSMSTHHHEYGFPSSHSTNSVSIAVFAAQWMWEARDTLGSGVVYSGWMVLFLYAFSVVFGRLYTGMHSTVDIIGGSLLGLLCNLLHHLFGASLETFVNTGSAVVPFVTIPATLAAVHYHPEPVDACPCFEDAIAVLSVIAGSFLGHWLGVRWGWTGAPALGGKGVVWMLLVAAVRVNVGIGILFVWRMIAKRVLLRVLPPIFRAASKGFDFQLPTRRGYMAATDYQSMPSQHIRTIPSFVDLHPETDDDDATPDTETEANAFAFSEVHGKGKEGGSGVVGGLSVPETRAGLRRRKEGGSDSKGKDKGMAGSGPGFGVGKEGEAATATGMTHGQDREKYDAEVLTKVGVYSGIGLLATTLVPRLFGVLERYLD